MTLIFGFACLFVFPYRNNPTLQEKICIKFSRDGAKMTRMKNFVVLSYFWLDTEDILSSKGLHY